jgi:ubiquinol-cytochrome c reductase iron-sulfur subunit
MPVAADRSGLKRSIKYFAIVLAAAISYVLFDFAFDLRPPRVHSSYQFNVSELPLDQARILRQDNLSVLVIRRSARTISALGQNLAGLQDPESKRSHQPGFAANLLRSSHPEYFVSYAIGTDFGCGLEVGESAIKEICGRARYDFAGRALQGDNKFLNLAVPDYTFTNNFNTLTIRP